MFQKLKKQKSRLVFSPGYKCKQTEGWVEYISIIPKMGGKAGLRGGELESTPE